MRISLNMVLIQSYSLKARLCATVLIATYLSAVFIAVSIASLASAEGLPEYDRVRILDPALPLKDVTLVDTDGEDFVLSQLEGNVLLVFFGFTN